MAKRAALLSEELALDLRRLRDFMRGQPKFRDQMRAVARPPGQEGRLFYNDSGEEIPPYACMEVTAHEVNNLYDAVKVDKIGTTWPGDILFNGAMAVAAGGFGYSQHCVEHALYSTGTPALGECFGIKPNEWKLFKGYPAVLRVRGVHDSTNKIIYGTSLLPVTTLLGQTTDAVSANTPTTDYVILAGTAGSESDAGFSTVPSAVCAISLESGTKVELFFVNNQWQMIPALTANSGTRLVKTTASHAANATQTVNVWVGTPGSEVLSTGPVTLSATNKSTSAIATDTFCLATRVNVADAGDPEDLQWYLVLLNAGTGGARWFKGNLSGSLTSSTATIGLTSVIAYDNGSTPGTLTANNVFGLAGPNSAPAIVVLRASDGSYDLVNLLHVTRTVINDIAWDGTTLSVDTKTLVTMDDNDDQNDLEVFTVIETSMVNDVELYGYNLRQTKADYKVFAKGDDTTTTILLGTVCETMPAAVMAAASQSGYQDQSPPTGFGQY